MAFLSDFTFEDFKITHHDSNEESYELITVFPLNIWISYSDDRNVLAIGNGYGGKIELVVDDTYTHEKLRVLIRDMTEYVEFIKEYNIKKLIKRI
jgi:hypothetical protein